MSENDPKLKLEMAKLLPEKIGRYLCGALFPLSKFTDSELKKDGFPLRWLDTGNPILETEWLYVMQLVEMEQEGHVALSYLWELAQSLNTNVGSFRHVCSTFNQRATAMCKVKGIKL